MPAWLLNITWQGFLFKSAFALPSADAAPGVRASPTLRTAWLAVAFVSLGFVDTLTFGGLGIGVWGLAFGSKMLGQVLPRL